MKKALIVGINDYPNAPLRGCVKDANAIANVLENNGDGSPNFAIRLLTSPSNSVTRSELRRAVEELFSGNADVALFYFSGHGSIKNTGGYIVTTDFERYDEGISMDDILVIANKSKISDKIIIIDCCYSGAFGSPAIAGGNFAQLTDGLTIMTASTSQEAAIETNERGIFTILVEDALKGGAADLRGRISPGSVYAYVDQALGPWNQRPIFKTNVSRFTSLRNIDPPVPLGTLRKIIEYFPTPQDEFKLDPSYEFTDESNKAEHVAVFKDLQKYNRVNLVVPVGEDHMYFAAMHSKSCKLTALGYQYWRLVKEKNI